MPWTAATAFACGQHRSQLVRFRLRPLARNIYVRPGTSDLSSLEQVFLEDQYNAPFELTPKVIVDAGANIGAASLYFLLKYPDAKVFAIEPDRSNFEVLSRNCAGFDRIVCIEAGLWPSATPLSFVDPAAERWALSLRPARNNEALVKSITIPHLISRYDIKKIDILKIDIEGAERELFSQEVDQWIAHVDTIVIELHDRFKDGCARAFYNAIHGRLLAQEIRGENIFVRLLSPMTVIGGL
jgi:FkbM family methyltransferase